MENLKLYVDHAIYECFGKTSEHGRRYLTSDLAPNQVRSVNFETENLDQKDGFNSNAIFGRIVYEDERRKKIYGVSIVVKSTGRSGVRSEFVDVMFSNEIYVYGRILPYFATFKKDVLNMFPKFYYGDLTVSREHKADYDMAMIILENLSSSGYRMTEFKSFLSIEELRLIVKNLAHFHAYSYHIKRKSPKDFHSLVSNLVETHFVDTRHKIGFLNSISDHHIALLSKHDEYAEKAKLISDLLKDADKFLRTIFTTAREPMAVLCHGDFLRNNVMIKYDPTGYPVDLKFFDLACCRYCSPVVDLALILYMNTNQKTRDLYWDDLIDLYCSSLRDPFPDNDVPSKEQVLQEFKINSLNAYLLVAFFLPNMMLHDEVPNYEVEKLFFPEFEEYLDVSWHEIPLHVAVEIEKRLRKPHHEQAVVEVLKDIIDRGYV